MKNSPEIRLLNLASSIALYNDKGWLWGGHNSDEILHQQVAFKNSLDEILSEIDRANLSIEVLKIVEDVNFITDDMGRFHTSLRQLISEEKFYKSKA